MPPIPFRRALVVANPVAGRGRARLRAEALVLGLEQRGVDTELFLTCARGDAAARVREADAVDLVVSVGGDGTLGEVLANLRPSVPVAVHPVGTANVLARDLCLPRNVAGTLAAIERGRTTEIDTARVNGRTSFLVVGVGIDGAIVRDVEERRRGPITKLFYLRSVLRALRGNRPARLTVVADGERLPGTYGWVLVSNIVGYGGVLRLSPERRLADGLFEVFPFPLGTRRALVGYGMAGLLRRLPGRCCKMVRAAHVRIEAESPTPYEVDGDYGGETPVELEVTPARHRLIVP